MQLIAHRGVHRNHPENTLAAFADSVELGLLAIETDLRLAADGNIVLFHDRFAGDRSVESLTRAELSRVVGYPVPTLSEALEAFPQVHWILELKTPQVLAPSLAVLGPHVGTHQLMLISFWHPLILAAADRIEIDLGFSLGNPALGFLDAAQAAREQHPRISTVIWNYEFLDAQMLQRAQEQAWRNLVFNTISTADDVHCAALRVDGVITDRPDKVITSVDSATARGLP